jgi:transcriptional regulator GlxA family with amidase domain
MVKGKANRTPDDMYLHTALQSCSRTQSAARSKLDPRILRILQLLSTASTSGIQLRQFSKDVNLSHSRLRHVFKLATGLPPGKYVRRLRMERARELLQTTFLSVKEVMACAGFNDQSHFVREYKKTFGATPSSSRLRLMPSLKKRKNPNVA